MPITSPFNAQSTALEVIAGHDLGGRTALVTGACAGSRPGIALLALVVYWLNLLLLGTALLGGLCYAKRSGLVREVRAAELHYEGYILTAQALYAFAVVLCLISTYISIALISKRATWKPYCGSIILTQP
jgi:hypothetical protein